MSPVIWSGRGGRGKKAKGRKEQRMRGINDRETLISGPSGDFFAAREGKGDITWTSVVGEVRDLGGRS